MSTLGWHDAGAGSASWRTWLPRMRTWLSRMTVALSLGFGKSWPVAGSWAIALPTAVVLSFMLACGHASGKLSSQDPSAKREGSAEQPAVELESMQRVLRGPPRNFNQSEILRQVAVYTPLRPALGTYGSPVRHVLKRGELYAATKMAERLGHHDLSMSRAARELAEILPAWGALPANLVEGVLVHSGVAGPVPRVYTVTVRDVSTECVSLEHVCKLAIAELDELVRREEARFGQRRFGVGFAPLAGGDTRLVLLVFDDLFELKPVSQRFERNRSLAISGRLLKGHSPRIELIDAKGEWIRLPAVQGDDQSFHVNLTCSAGRGRYQVEIVADDERGPHVVANFPVYCEMDVPRDIPYLIEMVGEQVSPQQMVDESFRRLNEERKRRNLPLLEWDVGLAQSALSHSIDMAENNFVGHVSPVHGDIGQRVRKARIEYEIVRENVAKGHGPQSIHESLMGSPGHRNNMLSADVSHVGIGVVLKRERQYGGGWVRTVFVTQHFADRGQSVPPDDELVQALVAHANRRRNLQGLAHLQVAKKLNAMALRDAKSFLRGHGGVPMSEIGKLSHVLGRSKIRRHQVRAQAWRDLLDLELWSKVDDRDLIGVSVVRVPAADGGGYVAVILVGEQELSRPAPNPKSPREPGS